MQKNFRASAQTSHKIMALAVRFGIPQASVMRLAVDTLDKLAAASAAHTSEDFAVALDRLLRNTAATDEVRHD